MTDQTKKWDVFISHASEDQESFVRPLARSLQRLGVRVWYAEFSLRVGASLSRSIDKGLAESRFGIVVVSAAFIRKRWPQYELAGLVSREIAEGRVILPLWHGVTRDDLLSFSPPLADKLAIKTAGARAEDVALQILREVRPDLYEKHPRWELEQRASGEALVELQAEIERTRQELEAAREALAQFRCPYCSAPLAERISAPADPLQKHWDLREIFECGYQSFGGLIEQPCPADPGFPTLEDYELQFHESPEEPDYKWRCYARPKTDMARRLSLSVGIGRTRGEAAQRVREAYDRYARQR